MHAGAGIALQAMPGAPWETLEVPMGTGCDAFDAEVVGVASALEWALDRYRLSIYGYVSVFILISVYISYM